MANAIYNQLFDEYRVFLDKETLKNGRFPEKLENEIKKSDDFLLLITQNTFDRCNDDNDWILRELKIALEHKKNIIPIFIDCNKFPNNIPDSLNDVCNFNAICWDDNFFKNLSDFLTSNKKINLSVIVKNQNAVLDKNSINQLATFLLHTRKYGRKSVDVSLQLVDDDKHTELYILNSWPHALAGANITDLIFSFKSYFIKQKQKFIPIIQSAIEMMLADEMLDTCGILMNNYYQKKYPQNFLFIKDDQNVCWRSETLLVWIEIIHKILTNLYTDINVLINTQDFWQNHIEVDCMAKTKSGNVLWKFTSFLKIDDMILRNQESTNRQEIADTFAYLNIDYLDLTPKCLVNQIYPDFYFKFCEMQYYEPQTAKELLLTYGFDNFYYYQFGLH